MDVFADENHIASRLSFVNVAGLNKLLRSEIFISEDTQLRVVHLILDYEPLSRIFQDVGHAIRVGDPRLAHIDVSKPEFLAQRDLSLVKLPIQRVPQEVAVSREETASTHLSLEVEINQFHLEEEGEEPERPIEVLDSEAGLDRFSAANFPRLVVAQIDTSSEEEEEMALNQRRSVRDLMAKRNKGSSSKETPKSQVPPTFPPPPPLPPTDLGLNAMKDLKKKRSVQDLEEGEVAPQKGMKQQKTTKDPKDKRSFSVDSREEQTLAKVCLQYRTWSPRLEVDGATIP